MARWVLLALSAEAIPVNSFCSIWYSLWLMVWLIPTYPNSIQTAVIVEDINIPAPMHIAHIRRRLL